MKYLTLLIVFSLMLKLIFSICGCKEAYQEDRKISKAYEDGFMQGVKMCKRSIGLHIMDSVMFDNYSIAIWEPGTIIKNKKVQSITSKADSIVILNFESTEIK